MLQTRASHNQRACLTQIRELKGARSKWPQEKSRERMRRKNEDVKDEDENEDEV